MPMTTANKLTLVRVFLIPVFLVVAYLDFPGHRYVALAVFIIASLTDLLDGHALITWLSCTAHVADHAMITQLPCTGHMTDHALIT